MTIEPKPSRYQEISETARFMLERGESGRYEFKRDVEAVSPRLLAALANWIALDPTLDVAHLLVGVDEVEDTPTGLVHGQPFGLPKGLDKAVSRIQDVATKTRPIPVDVFIVEEGVSTESPFVRVEVRPTMPPHFDDEGRRQTRQGRSTRALSDEELLRIYLDREAGSFAARYRQVSDELRSAVGAIGTQVDDIAGAIDESIARPVQELAATAHMAADAASSAESAADSAAASAMNAEYEAENVQRLVRDLRGVVGEIQNESLPNLAHHVMQLRRKVWWEFTVDTWKHSSARADRLQRRLHELLAAEISLDAARNTWELRIWDELLDDRKSQRGERGTQKWWDATIHKVLDFLESPAYVAPDLPDLRAAFKIDLDHELDDPESVTNQFDRDMNRS